MSNEKDNINPIKQFCQESVKSYLNQNKVAELEENQFESLVDQISFAVETDGLGHSERVANKFMVKKLVYHALIQYNRTVNTSYKPK